ncbi:MAG: NTP transferase domain-containing protein [Bacteroidales bacterium]|nr:NTP transferase domain-containing protein [Bacteroidales bacterium]
MKDIKKTISNRIVNSDQSLIHCLELMDKEMVRLLFVYDKDKFCGILTIGDIQRAILSNYSLNDPIFNILDSKKVYATPNEPKQSIKEKMIRLRAECMPVVDNYGNLYDVIFWEDYFPIEQTIAHKKLNLPVVIMAGGKGTRLLPLTNVIPKALIPIGNKTMLEIILDKFVDVGCENFFLSLGYKADVIKYYFNSLPHHYNIQYFVENKPLGTIGSISLIKDKLTQPFFVTNCDIIIDQDYGEVYEYHVENNNDITMVVAIKNYKIPYGVVKTGKNGVLTEIEEKPDLTHMINTGIYILNPELIDRIPDQKFFHVTELIENVQQSGGKVGCFPVSEGSWKDIGDWNEYLKYII